MAEGVARSFTHTLFRLGAALLCLHYLFILSLSQHLSVLGVVLFSAGLVSAVPPVRSRIADLPGL